MLTSFMEAFEKEAKRHNAMLERLRKGLPIKIKGQSMYSAGKTRLGRILRSLK